MCIYMYTYTRTCYIYIHTQVIYIYIHVCILIYGLQPNLGALPEKREKRDVYLYIHRVSDRMSLQGRYIAGITPWYGVRGRPRRAEARWLADPWSRHYPWQGCRCGGCPGLGFSVRGLGFRV